ncbi:TPA: response regulator [Enterobacter hormaechei]|uniref:response regulator transcription factor n=1 Tax=Enterobacter cloacae complex TaxID=354276 RepID=UPI00125B1944|nr:response regulator transcription factor [Enterobacter hormaechei]EKK5415858.1 response regulator transcription factor [Enterobacter hormaechei]VAL10825.1 LuxR family two component transcriptional regulator [Enterobacter hormaechei]
MKTALVVDDHPSVRMALKITLEKIGFTHVDECDNGAQAINQIKKGKYNIVILDIGIPNMDGMSVIAAVRKAEINTKILVFTSQSAELYASRCMMSGVSGFLTKNEGMEDVSAAIKAINSGFTFFPNISYANNFTLRKSSSLTNRELEVLRKIIAGMKNIEIADSMCLSSKTISTYKTRIMTKMGVTTLVDLIEIAKREKIE